MSAGRSMDPFLPSSMDDMSKGGDVSGVRAEQEALLQAAGGPVVRSLPS
jgi:hypothetical protein